MRAKKSFLPEKSRKLIGDRLLDLIFILIGFGVFWLIAGALLGLEPGESCPMQYYIAGVGASLPIAGRILQKAGTAKYRLAAALVWLAAAAAAGVLVNRLF